MPLSSGSASKHRVNKPSVITSTRVSLLTCRSTRVDRPMRWPSRSPRVWAIRDAAMRAAIRRGSSITMRPGNALKPSIKPASANGTRVVFPAPGGAPRINRPRARRVSAISGRIGSIGRSVIPTLLSSVMRFRNCAFSTKRRRSRFLWSVHQ